MNLPSAIRKFAVACLVVTAGCACAQPVEWTFEDVVFASGATLSGSFVYDAELGDYGSYLAAGIYYQGAAGTASFYFSVPSHVEQPDGSAVDNFATVLGERRVLFSYTYPEPRRLLGALDLCFLDVLDDGAGGAGIGLSGAFSTFGRHGPQIDGIVGGRIVSSVPEPGQSALLLGGGVLLLAWRRRKLRGERATLQGTAGERGDRATPAVPTRQRPV